MPCHKHILKAASPVLEALVETKLKEGTEGKADVNMSKEIGQAFLKFIYTGEVDDATLTEHALGLLIMGEIYDLKELKDLAEVALIKGLSKDNMVEMIATGELHRANDLFEAALAYTKSNITWLRKQVLFNA